MCLRYTVGGKSNWQIPHSALLSCFTGMLWGYLTYWNYPSTRPSYCIILLLCRLDHIRSHTLHLFFVFFSFVGYFSFFCVFLSYKLYYLYVYVNFATLINPGWKLINILKISYFSYSCCLVIMMQVWQHWMAALALEACLMAQETPWRPWARPTQASSSMLLLPSPACTTRVCCLSRASQLQAAKRKVGSMGWEKEKRHGIGGGMKYSKYEVTAEFNGL